MPENSLDHLFIDERFYNAKDYSTDGGGKSVLARSDQLELLHLTGDFFRRNIYN